MRPINTTVASVGKATSTTDSPVRISFSLTIALATFRMVIKFALHDSIKPTLIRNLAGQERRSRSARTAPWQPLSANTAGRCPLQVLLSRLLQRDTRFLDGNPQGRSR